MAANPEFHFGNCSYGAVCALTNLAATVAMSGSRLSNLRVTAASNVIVSFVAVGALRTRRVRVDQRHP